VIEAWLGRPVRGVLLAVREPRRLGQVIAVVADVIALGWPVGCCRPMIS
jgi:hypothetical protein